MLTALVAVLGLLAAPLAPAHAAVNTRIQVTNLKVTRIDDQKNEIPGQLVVGSTIGLLSYDVDASGVDVNAGDSFAIGVPAPFLATRSSLDFPLTYDFGDGAQTEIARCVTTKQRLECTFNEEMERRVDAGNTVFRLTGTYELAPTGATTNETLGFTVNDNQTVQVDLPGTGGISTGSPARYVPLNFAKGVAGLSDASTVVTWSLVFGTERLQDAYRAAGRTVTFDGQSAQTVSLTDTLGPGASCPDADDLKRTVVRRTNSAADPAGADRLDLDSAVAGATTTAAGTFDLAITCGTATAAGTPVTIVLTGPLAARTNYQIAYTTPVTSATGKAVPGLVYTNTASIDGTDLTSTASRSFMSQYSQTVTMDRGFGTFRVNKLVAGPAVDTIAVGTPFAVDVAYELPAGTTSADFPGWTAPGTLNADGRTGTARLNVPFGTVTPFVGPNPARTFPAGTTVTLTEPAQSAALPAGYSWRPGVFKVGATATDTVTIADGQATLVDLTNTTSAAEGSFTITKNVVAPAGFPAPLSYDFTYTCTAADAQDITGHVTIAPGASWTSPAVPVGYSCSVAEQAVQVSGYDLVVDNGSAVTIASGTVPAVTVTNTYTKQPAVSVGDYVFEDVNKDGLQDAGDKPLANVTLTISRSDGAPVTAADGTALATLTTTSDAAGAYSFSALAALPAGTHYVVSVTVPDGYEPTADGAGTADKDSSAAAGKAESGDLVNDGDADLTLDFGFVAKDAPAPADPSAQVDPSANASGAGTASASSGGAAGGNRSPQASRGRATSGADALAIPSEAPERAKGGLARSGVLLLLPLVVAIAVLGAGVLMVRRRQE